MWTTLVLNNTKMVGIIAVISQGLNRADKNSP